MKKDHLLESDRLMKELNDRQKMAITISSSLLKLLQAQEVQLSCLSCSRLVSDPLMLSCGHSICPSCLTKHSDPKSKDSIVFCEDCKLETKNK